MHLSLPANFDEFRLPPNSRLATVVASLPLRWITHSTLGYSQPAIDLPGLVSYPGFRTATAEEIAAYSPTPHKDRNR